MSFCTTLDCLDVTVEYRFIKGEREIRYYAGRLGGLPNGDGHPGCPDEVEILSVKSGNFDILPALGEKHIAELEEMAMEDAYAEDEP